MVELNPRLLDTLKRGSPPQALLLVSANRESAEAQALSWVQARLCPNFNKSGHGACGTCGSCLRIAKKQSESLLWVASENDKISLDDAQGAARFLQLRQLGAARVVVVPAVAGLSPQATNSLLKVVEEPPENSHFIFLAEDTSQLLPTLRSRVQVFRLPSERASAPEPEKLNEVVSWLDVARSEYAVDSWRDLAGDRDSAVNCFLAISRVLRDWAVLGSSELLHEEFKSVLIRWPDVPLYSRIEMWRESERAIRDIKSYVDRSLVFEDFSLRWHSLFAKGN